MVITLAKILGSFLFITVQPIKVPTANAYGINVLYVNYTFFLC